MAISVIEGDCRDVLKTLPDASVHCVVTSPPYYGLRDYGNDQQIGLEPTPDAYVVELVAVFREARRVLRDDGTLWLNLGDSYNAHPGQRKVGDKAGARQQTNRGASSAPSRNVEYLKPKDLIGIPWMVAFALRADGWFLRQDVIWSKPNAMPESVTDRCTKAHEYIFMLSKSVRYWYDAAAIAEQEVMKPQRRLTPREDNPNAKVHGLPLHRRPQGGTGGGTRNRRSVWTIATQPYKGAHFATMPPDLAELCIKAGCPKGGTVLDPFGGAGTTGLVADRLGRNAILIDLNSSYAQMAQRRIEDDAGMFSTVLEATK